MAIYINKTPPCVVFEDEHLLVARKPAGWNTHAPSPYSGEGIYDWLRNREPRWSRLAILHRLDKETSGIIVFGKTTLANRSLTEQFTQRQVVKRYTLWTRREPPTGALGTVKTGIRRAGDRYVECAIGTGEGAETHFELIGRVGDIWAVQAEPRTGRTHQIRVHAAARGFAVLGDRLYGGGLFPRMCLHASFLGFTHPATSQPQAFEWPPEFDSPISAGLRSAVIDAEETDAFRAIHGQPDGFDHWYADRLGEFVLAQTDGSKNALPVELMSALGRPAPAKGIYLKRLTRSVGKSLPEEVQARLAAGDPAPEPHVIQENGVRYELKFNEGYSVGLFLDQRDNRRHLLTRHVAADFALPEATDGGGQPRAMLNAFAYTCGFSVCAALAGFRATSLDLSRKSLDWGRRNFALNGLDPAAHDFIYGDAFEWLRRLEAKGRRFDVAVLDPPTFSRSRETGTFRAEKDYGRLASLALPLIAPEGVLLASVNAARLDADAFIGLIREAAAKAGRMVVREHFAAQPPDFPVSPEAPGYLKTVWMKFD